MLTNYKEIYKKAHNAAIEISRENHQITNLSVKELTITIYHDMLERDRMTKNGLVVEVKQ